MRKKEIRARLVELRLHHNLLVETGEQVEMLTTDLIGDLLDHIDSKSERWQESEAGQAIQELIDALGDLEELDIVAFPSFGV